MTVVNVVAVKNKIIYIYKVIGTQPTVMYVPGGIENFPPLVNSNSTEICLNLQTLGINPTSVLRFNLKSSYYNF